MPPRRKTPQPDALDLFAGLEDSATPAMADAPRMRDILPEEAQPTLSQAEEAGAVPEFPYSETHRVVLTPKEMPEARGVRVFLVDGDAVLHRALHAVKTPLVSSTGELTSGSLGVARFIQQFWEIYKPTHVVWVHDAGDSGRKALYPKYKSTRKERDAAFKDAFNTTSRRTDQILTALGVPVLRAAGYEADDTIGTLAHQLLALGHEAVIVSGDKDFHQLLCDGVSILAPGRGENGLDQWIDAQTGSARLGVRPDQVIDYLAIVGDRADTIPGVYGVGEKGARELLDVYDSLDEILAHASTLPKPKYKKAFVQYAADALMSRQLATIQREVPHGLNVEEVCQACQPRWEEVEKIYLELDFRSMINRAHRMKNAADYDTELDKWSGEDVEAPAAAPPPPAPGWFDALNF